jgi:hypothetical protein
MRAPKVAVFVTSAVFAVGGFLSEPAWTQNAPARPAVGNVSVKPIGKVVTVKGTASIDHVNAVVVQVALGNKGNRAKVGDPVYLGDIVQTGADGQIGITFTDSTAFDLSSNARMEMTEFIYDPNSNSNSSLLSLTKGTFTFVAGKIAKTGDMKVDTPVATMGIRGTTPRVEISDDGTVKFSTLIEEGKDKVVQNNGVPPVKPQDADNAKPREKINLNICRGC